MYVSDLSKAFLTIKLEAPTTSLLRWFWFKNGLLDPSEELVELVNCTNLFGASAAPCLLYHGIGFAYDRFLRPVNAPLAERVMFSRYMDDCFTPFRYDTPSDVRKREHEQHMNALRQAGFNVKYSFCSGVAGLVDGSNVGARSEGFNAPVAE